MMTMTTREKISQAIAQLDSTFVQRTEAIKCVWLALLTGQNFILVGDPGTAKTALVNACYSHIADARVFNVLCGSFATEDKIFGPVDIASLKNSAWKRNTKGRLADCDLGFLDEMLKANDGTLNGMLTALNERVYDGEKISLRTAGAATNWPEVMSRSDNVAALWDRVLFRARVDEVTSEEGRMALLTAVDKVARYKAGVTITLAELDEAREQVRAIGIGEDVRRSIVKTQESLEKQKIKNSSRRYGALQHGLRAMAWLDGRNKVMLDDFDALAFGLWTNRDHIEPVRTIIESVDAHVVNECLTQLKAVTKQCRDNASVQAAPGLIKLSAKAATDAKNMLDKYGARQKGRQQIKDAIGQLKEVYKQLRAKVQPHLEQAKEAADADL
jgi:MoxR-like ATPase